MEKTAAKEINGEERNEREREDKDGERKDRERGNMSHVFSLSLSCVCLKRGGK